MSHLVASKLKNPKSAISINIFLSRIDKEIYVAIDGNLIDLEEFGIDENKFSLLGEEIDSIVQKILGK